MPSESGHGSQPYQEAWRGLRGRLGVAAGFSAVVNVLMLTGSIYMLQVYDRVLTSGSVATLVALFAIVVVLHLFLAGFDFLRLRVLGRAGVRLDRVLGDRVFTAWVRSGIPGAPGAAAQPLRDLEALRGFLSGPGLVALFDAPWIPLFLLVLFVIHPWIGWLTVGGAVLVIALAWLNQRLSGDAVSRGMTLDAAERGFAEQGRRNAEAVVSMGMQDAVVQRWRSQHDRTLATTQTGSDPSELIAALSRGFRMLLQSAVLTVGAWLVLRHEISAGMIIAASVLSGRALAPVDQAIGQWRGIGRALEAHRRLRAFFAAQPDTVPHIDLPLPKGAVEVLGVTKHAPGAARSEKTRILDGIRFRLEPGDGVGVIGNSAAGKSTLARILVGAWDPDEGEIRLDGATPTQWDRRVLGRAIGYLPQNVELFPGTIRDNIARFDPDATDAAVMAAAELAGVHEMILQLPEGYAARVGDPAAGVQLSGGQIQRIGLARAVYGTPHLVVLDEPNANLDMAGDEALSRAIRALRARGAIVVVVAHRPSAIAALNKVLVLKAGRVQRFGEKQATLTAVLGTPVPVSAMGTKPASAASGPTAATAPAPAYMPKVLMNRVAAKLQDSHENDSASPAPAQTASALQPSGDAQRRAVQ